MTITVTPLARSALTSALLTFVLMRVTKSSTPSSVLSSRGWMLLIGLWESARSRNLVSPLSALMSLIEFS